MGEPTGFTHQDFYILRHELVIIDKNSHGNWEDVTDGLSLKVHDSPHEYENYLRWESEAVECSIYLRMNGDEEFLIFCKDNGEMNAAFWVDDPTVNAQKIWDTIGNWS